jgi:Mrp family chromosome partitioning ATPase
MLRTLLICANDSRRLVIQAAADETRLIRVVDSFGRYPDGNSIARALARFSPALAIVDGEDFELALTCAGTVRREAPQVAILGVNATRELYGPLTQAIPVTIPYPPDVELLAEAVSETVHRGVTPFVEKLLAFLPAKAGAGASTIALNTASAMASLGKRTLLMDTDLRSGVLSFRLNCIPIGSIQKALEASADEVTMAWKNYITRAHEVDFLLSSRVAPASPPNWAHYYTLIQASIDRYDLVLADLPELVNPATAEIVRSARYVMVVTTQEVLSLKMAERRTHELIEWCVPEDRIKILVNRWHRKEISKAEIEKFLKRPVYATFDNDFPAARKATMDGAPVAATSGLGSSFRAFAQKLTGVKTAGWLAKLRRS